MDFPPAPPQGSTGVTRSAQAHSPRNDRMGEGQLDPQSKHCESIRGRLVLAFTGGRHGSSIFPVWNGLRLLQLRARCGVGGRREIDADEP